MRNLPNFQPEGCAPPPEAPASLEEIRGARALLETCKAALAEEYPEVAEAIRITLPDEKFRRVGQSAAAASLPELAK